jgi:hypothetical protein
MRSLTLIALLTCAVFVPAEDTTPELLPADRPIPSVIDHYINRELREQEIPPAPLADDATLLRRLTLDLNGRIPTAAEYSAYLASTDPQKKEKLVDRLMASPAFIRHLVEDLDAMLVVPGANNRRGSTGSVREYLTRAIKENRGWDKIYRDLLLADDKQEKGSAAFLKARVKDQDRLTTDVSVLFYGVNISCAQCHDHPLVDDWKQEHFYGLKSFLARTYEQGPFLGERDAGVVSFKTPKNENKTARMMFLTGKVIDAPGMVAEPKGKNKEQAKKNDKNAEPPPAPKFSARAKLIEVSLEADQRHFFAKNLVNRMWHRLYGVGLVSPIDQMHSENPPTHPELLDWLARDTANHGYDLRRLIRGLVLSDAYARASQYPGEKQPDAQFFAMARLRPLTPMQLVTSIRVGAASPEFLAGSLKTEELEKRIENLEAGGRGFASLLEQPRDDFQISVLEALLFSNSDRVQKEFLSDSGDRLIGTLKTEKNLDRVADLLFTNLLIRKPTPEEKGAVMDYLNARKDRPVEALRQVTWALITSAEFRFNY